MESGELTRADLDRFVDDQAPFIRAMGISCEEIGRGHAVARLRADARWMRPGNIVCGGVLMALADAAIYFAILGQVGLRPMAVTNELKMNFLRPASGGDLLARARVLKAGRRIAYGEIHLHMSGNPDTLIAHATSSYVLPAEGTGEAEGCRAGLPLDQDHCSVGGSVGIQAPGTGGGPTGNSGDLGVPRRLLRLRRAEWKEL